MTAGPSDEAPLTGGRVTAGAVRVGDTVRRPPTPNSDFVRRLLQHLTEKGFHGAPVALGVDDRGRDIFSFIEGEAPADLSVYEDEVLGEAAALIRQYHDVTADLLGAEAARKSGLEVICHNDLSPCNFVFQEGAPKAIIDFDAAAPGTRAYDLGYAAWLWLDLGSSEISPAHQGRRLSLFKAAYGADKVERLLPAIMQRQVILAAQAHPPGGASTTGWAKACLQWTLRNKDVLEKA